MKKLSVGVVGCGSGGPASAAMLARAGHDVVLFEEAPELTAVGAGILLQPTGMEVLHELDVLGRILDHGHPVHHLHGESASGRMVLDIPYADIEEGVHGLGMYRPTLLTILVEAMAHYGADLELGCPMMEIERHGARSSLIERHGRRRGPFDLVVLADGARSHLRNRLGLARRAEVYPWGALFFIGEDRLADAPSQTLSQVFRGSGTFAGLLPTGRGIDSPAPLMSLFWSVRNDRVPQWRREGLDHLAEQVVALMPEAESMVAQIPSMDALMHARYLDVVLDRMWLPGIVCLGDHAHAMSPQLGQGVNMALLDAQALAHAVDSHTHLSAALGAFDAARRAHLDFYQPVNRLSTPFFQSDLAPLGWFRDFALSQVSRIPLLRRQQALTMAGLKTGPLTDRPVSRDVRTALLQHAGQLEAATTSTSH